MKLELFITSLRQLGLARAGLGLVFLEGLGSRAFPTGPNEPLEDFWTQFCLILGWDFACR